MSWKKVIGDEFEKEYFLYLMSFLDQEISRGKIIFPQQDNIFSAFNATPFDKIKVVVLWQDPYHGQGQAHWLSFSVNRWVKKPPSLKNIYKELSFDLWIPEPEHWCLSKWGAQWVLMLNAILTVEENKPLSHADIWWQIFTDRVIHLISQKLDWIVFLLWGAFAQSKKNLIDTTKHFVLKTSHPSPFSAHKWFLWSWCFSKTNELLHCQNKSPIERFLD